MRRVLPFATVFGLFCLLLVLAAPATADENAKTKKPQADKAAAAKTDAAKKAEAKKPAEKKTPAKEKTAKAKEAKPEKTAKKEPKKATVVQLTLKDDYPEGPAQEGLFSEVKVSLAQLIEKLDQAATDKAVDAVWLRMDDVQLGRGKVNEIRQAIGRVRKAGKPVFAELASADAPQYLVAAACDEVVMPPSGMLIVPGVRAEVTFFKGLLDKVGLEFDALQMGKYKGAAEPMTRTKMSAPLRESLEALIDDTYSGLVDTIAADRRLKDYQVKSLLDQGLFSAAGAEKAKLIDHVLYADQFQQSLRQRLKADKVEVVTKYKKKQIDTDFSGITGFMKFMELVMGGNKTETAGTGKKIAVVYAVGPIVEGESTTSMFGEGSVGSTTLVNTLKKAIEDPKVVAIVLRIDSPGGSATASDLIWRETVRTKKPLVASMGDVAGSGGYYIAMGAGKIYAEPGTLTGSIGVIGGKLVTGKLFAKLGVNTEVISRGAMSGSLSSLQPFTPEERKVWTGLLEETYHQFVSKAAQGRKMDYKKLEQLAQGRVYTGRMAKSLGLVDELGTLQDAIAAAKKAAGIKEGEKVELQVLPKPKTVFEQLFGDQSLSTDLDTAMPELVKPLRQAASLRRLFSEPRLLWMPYEIRVK